MKNESRSSIGLPTLLLVLFIGLKLTGYINWSWWWVLAPFWLPLVLELILLGIIAAAEYAKKELKKSN